MLKHNLLSLFNNEVRMQLFRSHTDLKLIVLQNSALSSQSTGIQFGLAVVGLLMPEFGDDSQIKMSSKQPRS